MSSYLDMFSGKRITLMGLGLLGRGVGDAEFLAQCGAQVTVTDKKSAAELKESIDKIRFYPNIEFHLGGHTIKDFTDTDMVIKGAGVPLNSPEIAAARNAGVPVYMSTALFVQFAMKEGINIIGVTGTRGKSTTSYLINRTLAHAGRRTHYGGNVRGVSTLAMMAKIEPGDFAVLELDSWQLQGFGDLKISPHISVFTNLMPDHLNYYAQSSALEDLRAGMEMYFNDKANIFKYQKEGDFLFVGPSIEEKIRQANPPVEPIVPSLPPKEWHIQILGTHNQENVALSGAALAAAGLSQDEIRTGVETFTGIEGRLQFLREIRVGTGSVKIYNDNNATTPEATLAALRALSSGKKNIILIIGGADKGLEVNTLLYEISKTCKRVICLAGSGTTRITPLMSDYSIYDALEPALAEAVRSAVEGDTILFSPAFASFGMFKNEYDRGDQFLSLVRSL